MFNILDHLDKLVIERQTSTNYRCICPICKNNNLTINKKNGAFKCWNCLSNKVIRDILEPPIFSARIPKAEDVFVPRSMIKLQPEKIPLPHPYSLLYSNSCLIVEKPKSYSHRFHYYSDTQRVYRGFNYETDEKTIYFSSRASINDNWVWNAGSEVWNCYKYDDILTFSSASKDANTLLFVEGEKVVEDFIEFGLMATTAPGHSWNEDWIRESIRKIIKNTNIKNFLYVPDSDEIGDRKAKLFLNSCWFEKIPCDILTLDQIFHDKSRKGDDFSDLSLQEKISLVKLLAK